MRMHVPLRPMDPEVLSLECASLCAWSLEDIDASLWLSFLQAVVSEDSVPVDQFVEHMLPSLLSLAADPVPNVRVLLAKALRQTLLEKAYFRNAGNHHLQVVEETLLALQSDPDQDVSFFASLEPKMQNATDSTVLEN